MAPTTVKPTFNNTIRRLELYRNACGLLGFCVLLCRFLVPIGQTGTFYVYFFTATGRMDSGSVPLNTSAAVVLSSSATPSSHLYDSSASNDTVIIVGSNLPPQVATEPFYTNGVAAIVIAGLATLLAAITLGWFVLIPRHRLKMYAAIPLTLAVLLTFTGMGISESNRAEFNDKYLSASSSSGNTSSTILTPYGVVATDNFAAGPAILFAALAGPILCLLVIGMVVYVRKTVVNDPTDAAFVEPPLVPVEGKMVVTTGGSQAPSRAGSRLGGRSGTAGGRTTSSAAPPAGAATRASQRFFVGNVNEGGADASTANDDDRSSNSDVSSNSDGGGDSNGNSANKGATTASIQMIGDSKAVGGAFGPSATYQQQYMRLPPGPGPVMVLSADEDEPLDNDEEDDPQPNPSAVITVERRNKQGGGPKTNNNKSQTILNRGRTEAERSRLFREQQKVGVLATLGMRQGGGAVNNNNACTLNGSELATDNGRYRENAALEDDSSDDDSSDSAGTGVSSSRGGASVRSSVAMGGGSYPVRQSNLLGGSQRSLAAAGAGIRLSSVRLASPNQPPPSTNANSGRPPLPSHSERERQNQQQRQKEKQLQRAEEKRIQRSRETPEEREARRKDKKKRREERHRRNNEEGSSSVAADHYGSPRSSKLGGGDGTTSVRESTTSRRSDAKKKESSSKTNSRVSQRQFVIGNMPSRRSFVAAPMNNSGREVVIPPQNEDEEEDDDGGTLIINNSANNRTGGGSGRQSLGVNNKTAEENDGDEAAFESKYGKSQIYFSQAALAEQSRRLLAAKPSSDTSSEADAVAHLILEAPHPPHWISVIANGFIICTLAMGVAMLFLSCHYPTAWVPVTAGGGGGSNSNDNTNGGSLLTVATTHIAWHYYFSTVEVWKASLEMVLTCGDLATSVQHAGIVFTIGTVMAALGLSTAAIVHRRSKTLTGIPVLLYVLAACMAVEATFLLSLDLQTRENSAEAPFVSSSSSRGGLQQHGPPLLVADRNSQQLVGFFSDEGSSEALPADTTVDPATTTPPPNTDNNSCADPSARLNVWLAPSLVLGAAAAGLNLAAAYLSFVLHRRLLAKWSSWNVLDKALTRKVGAKAVR